MADLSNSKNKEKIAREIFHYAESHLEENDRVRLCTELGKFLKVDYAPIAIGQFLSLMNPDEIRMTAQRGVEIQLHTHRHRLPKDRASAIREIEDNRKALKEITGKDAIHLCYPDGIYQEEMFPHLREAGVRSGVTCDPGINFHHGESLAFKRLADSDNISSIRFEAEMSGLIELLRKLRKSFQ